MVQRHIIDEGKYALAYLDLSTGEGKVQYVEGDERTLISEIEALGMKEVVVGEGLHIALSDSMAKRNIMHYQLNMVKNTLERQRKRSAKM